MFDDDMLLEFDKLLFELVLLLDDIGLITLRALELETELAELLDDEEIMLLVTTTALDGAELLIGEELLVVEEITDEESNDALEVLPPLLPPPQEVSAIAITMVTKQFT